MIKSYFLITIRSMIKNKWFIIINIFGMGVAIACCIVGYFAYQHDVTFDSNHKNWQNIYRVSAVREFQNNFKKFGFVPMPLGNIVSETMKDVDQSSRYFYSHSNFKRDADLFSSNLSYVDPDFFSIFSFDFISGNPHDITDNTSLFVSEQMAIRLFGSAQEAQGKNITQVYGSDLKELKIAGVFKDQPQNSSFYKTNGCAFLNFENRKEEFHESDDNDWKQVVTLFVKVNDPTRVSSITKQLQPYKANNNKVREDFIISELVLDNLPGMAHADRAQELDKWTWYSPPISAIVGSAVMGILILLIACFNLTNTAVAISSRRLKEIGIRKVMGSMRKQLIIQFLSETTFICFLGLVVGLCLAEFLVDGWNYLWDEMRLTTHYLDNGPFLGFLITVLVFTGLLAGSYPAFYISKFEAISILKGKLKFGGANLFSKILLGLQFAISLIAIISAIGFLQNARYQRSYDLGFDVRGSVIAWVGGSNEFDIYRNSLQGNSEIISIAGASSGIFSNRSHEPIKHESKQIEADIISVGDNYLKTMDVKLIDGRDFNKDSETDQKESVIISQKLATMFGWDKPLGKEIIYKDTIKLYVVGVIKDVYTTGLWRELDPMMIRYITSDKYTQIVVSGSSENVAGINQFMEGKWKEVFPNRLYNGRMFSMDIQEVADVNNNIVKMFVFLGIIAMLLSATGLFTLVSLNIIKRMKEIGVRKVLGASIGNIARIINLEFVIILIIASVLGSVMSYLLVNALMSSIWRYYQGLNALTFTLSIALLFIISLLTISYKIYSAAATNPVNTLRDE
jgi:putative ABC transport system permease protein